jgi:hypothetical protein
VRAGPNGTDCVLGDKERRFTEIFLDYAGICPLFFVAVRRMYINRIKNTGDRIQKKDKIWISAFAGMTKEQISVLIGVNLCLTKCKLKKQSQFCMSQNKRKASNNNELWQRIAIRHLVKTKPNKANITVHSSLFTVHRTSSGFPPSRE